MADDVRMFAVFDADGRPLGFYPTDVHPQPPQGAVEISIEDWHTLLAKQPFATYRDGKVMISSEPTPSALDKTPRNRI